MCQCFDQAGASSRNNPGSNSILGSTLLPQLVAILSSGSDLQPTTESSSSNQRSFFISLLGQWIVCNNSFDWLIYLKNITESAESKRSVGKYENIYGKYNAKVSTSEINANQKNSLLTLDLC